jgi:hypothetical protein
MPITFDCTCGKMLRVPDEHAGRRAKCPACGSVVPIPGPDPVFEVVEKPKPGAAPPPGQKPATNPDDDDSDDGGTYKLGPPESTLDNPSGRRPRGRPGLY